MNGNLRIFFGVLLLLVSFVTYSQPRNNISCGINKGYPLTNAYGPFDYTNPSHASEIPRVLSSHFTPIVERLIAGTGNPTPYGDIDYTLRAIPNYHRALFAMSKLQIRDKTLNTVTTKFYSASCYFERAIYFQPKDAVVRMLYGLHLHRVGELESALKRYKEALLLDPDNPEFNYNIGLLYVDLKDKDSAVKHAKIATLNGYPLDGLNNKINRMD
ncbi:tetratricopeptide repeat protein [Motiliproteus coralliicola]|nr:tetratricopeptide repeat protein [Motiliproteus coralliicola]